MQCPNCKGTGRRWGYGCPGFKIVIWDCEICSGTGQLPENMQYDPDRGKQLKEDRISSGAVMTKRAKELEITASELSKMERGFFAV